MRLPSGASSVSPLATPSPEGASRAPPPCLSPALLSGLTPAAARRFSKDTTCCSADPAPSPSPPRVTPLSAEFPTIAKNCPKEAGDIVRCALGGSAAGVIAPAANSETLTVVVFHDEDIGAYNLTRGGSRLPKRRALTPSQPN